LKPPIPDSQVIAVFAATFGTIPIPTESPDILLSSSSLFWQYVSLYNKELNKVLANALPHAVGFLKMVSFKDTETPDMMMDPPFGRRPSFNISNVGVVKYPTQGEFSISAVYGASTEHVSGPTYGHGISLYNGTLRWNIAWFSPHTTKANTHVLGNNIQSILRNAVSARENKL